MPASESIMKLFKNNSHSASRGARVTLPGITSLGSFLEYQPSRDPHKCGHSDISPTNVVILGAGTQGEGY